MSSEEKQLALLLSPLSVRESRAPQGDVLRANIIVAKAIANVIRSTYPPSEKGNEAKGR